MKLGSSNSALRWAPGALGLLFAAGLLAHSLGVPDVGCGSPPEELVNGGVDDDLSRSPVPLKVVLVWDIPGPDGAAWKLGEGAISSAGFTFALPTAPPDEVLVDGAVGVAHFVAVAAGKSIPDGLLSTDNADLLTQAALGSSGAFAVVYKAAASDKYPWLDSFPDGASCAHGEAPAAGARTAGGAPLAGFSSVTCRGLKLTSGAIDNAAFTNWAMPAVAMKGPR